MSLTGAILSSFRSAQLHKISSVSRVGWFDCTAEPHHARLYAAPATHPTLVIFRCSCRIQQRVLSYNQPERNAPGLSCGDWCSVWRSWRAGPPQHSRGYRCTCQAGDVPDSAAGLLINSNRQYGLFKYGLFSPHGACMFSSLSGKLLCELKPYCPASRSFYSLAEACTATAWRTPSRHGKNHS